MIYQNLLRAIETSKGDVRGFSHAAHVESRLRSEIADLQDQNDKLNIAESDTSINYQKLQHAIEVANISDLIETLPLGYNTMIGAKGNGISQGQKQRILIARAVYKNPDVLFLDEATNSLDATNEQQIVENLNQFLKTKTVVVVAHRLSTVINADQIIVLDNGKIVEQGTHQTLLKAQGKYYKLIQNQLNVEQIGTNEA